MARVHLDLPASLPFSTVLVVRVTDLNFAGHLGNDRFLTLAHEARVRYLEALGVGESDVFGARIVIADAAIRYRAEVFAGDRLRWDLGFQDWARVGCDLVYRVSREGDGVCVAELKTGIVFLDPDADPPRTVPVPGRLRAAVGAGG